MSVLRSVSPIHIEYLRNMGVGASMSVAVLDFMPEYRKMIACDGIAVWSEGETTLDGETPGENEVKDLVAFINRTSPGRNFPPPR